MQEQHAPLKSNARRQFRRFPLLIMIWVSVFFGGDVVLAQTRSNAQVPSYRVSFPERKNHYFEVQGTIPTRGLDDVELWIAAWTPGSYKIRDYSRFIESLQAATPAGHPLKVLKIGKDRWRVPAAGIDSFNLQYRVYGREMSVRTNYVEERFAMLNGAATWVVPSEQNDHPFDIQFLLPNGWNHSETGLPRHPSGDPHRYLAPDYDTLVDCPVVLGDLAIERFEVGGVPHSLISHGGTDLWDFKIAAADCQKIVEVQTDMWGDIPYQSYRFLNMIVESGGGLEHKNSTLIMTSRYSFRDREKYRRWLGLVSHEFFHTWNVKRLRPIALGPFDYTQEVHTDDLWVVEGITSYYDDLMLARAGLYSQKQYLKALSKQIEDLQKTPGRKVHPLSETSHDAWTHFYQRHENSSNTTISYYTKGAVVGFLLDMEVRRLTEGQKSLDDVMRLAYQRYSGAHGYTSQQFRDCASEVAGKNLDHFFHHSVDSTSELDYTSALEWLGLRFKPTPSDSSDVSKSGEKSADASEPSKSGDEAEIADSEATTPGWIGLSASDRDGRYVISSVRRETVAYEIGLNVGDEVIAVDQYRVDPKSWSARMKQYAPGDQVSLLISRRGELLRIPVTLGKKPEASWKLEVLKEATPQQQAALSTWLRSENDTPKESPSDDAPAGVGLDSKTKSPRGE